MADSSRSLLGDSGAGPRLYRVRVRGGGSFLYDAIDVGRFARRMDEWGDSRPYTVKPWTWWRRLIEWALGR